MLAGLGPLPTVLGPRFGLQSVELQGTLGLLIAVLGLLEEISA